MRPGLNCTSGITDSTGSATAKAAAHGPARRKASLEIISCRMKNSSAGHTMRVAISAPSAPNSGRNSSISRASGASISRDQCETSGSGAPMRGSVVSNHGAPASSSRTVTRRTASSVSPSQFDSAIGPVSGSSTNSSAVASAHQASRLGCDPAQRRPPESPGGTPGSETCNAIAAPLRPIRVSLREWP